MTTKEFIQKKETFNETRLSDISKLLAKIPELNKYPVLSVYVTGSYARLEASEHSDLDIFFVHDGNEQEKPSKIDEIMIDSGIINMARSLNFPDFSGDGKYLVRHDIKDILNKLGSDEDDYKNFFTARLLYLLESRPIYNETVYNDMLTQIVARYYNDFHDHTESFEPIFLANDIMRFWKTLTINYEHRRNRIPEERKPKAHLENLKLKFSRKLTCFSFLLLLISRKTVLQEKDIIEIVKLTPIQRLMQLQAAHPKHIGTIEAILEKYTWFLDSTARPKEVVLDWISRKSDREEAFKHSREYGELIYMLLRQIDSDTDEKFLKFLVI